PPATGPACSARTATPARQRRKERTIDPITIASLVAMLAGAGLQYKASTDASKRQKEQALQSQQRQLAAQNEATAAAAKRAGDFDPTTRQQNQQQIQDQLTDTYDKQV